MNSKNLSRYAPAVLRLGLTAVFVWFGVSQIMSAAAWVGLVPPWATGFGMSAVTIVHLNGWFEVVAGLSLALGIYVRPVAMLLSLHLFVIAFELGINPIGVRDFGLSFATLALALFGQDAYCLYYAQPQ